MGRRGDASGTCKYIEKYKHIEKYNYIEKYKYIKKYKIT